MNNNQRILSHQRDIIQYPHPSLQNPYLIPRRKKNIKPPDNFGTIVEELQHAIDHCSDGKLLGFVALAEIYEVDVERGCFGGKGGGFDEVCEGHAGVDEGWVLMGERGGGIHC